MFDDLRSQVVSRAGPLLPLSPTPPRPNVFEKDFRQGREQHSFRSQGAVGEGSYEGFRAHGALLTAHRTAGAASVQHGVGLGVETRVGGNEV